MGNVRRFFLVLFLTKKNFPNNNKCVDPPQQTNNNCLGGGVLQTKQQFNNNQKHFSTITKLSTRTLTGQKKKSGFSVEYLLTHVELPKIYSQDKTTQNKSTRSAVTVRICMFVRSRKNLHTCKLPLAGSRSPLVKYARGSHIGFRSTSQTRSCALRMPRYVTFTLLPDLGITQRTALSRSFESATSSERNALGTVVVLGRVSGPTLTMVAVVAFRCCGILPR